MTQFALLALLVSARHVRAAAPCADWAAAVDPARAAPRIVLVGERYSGAQHAAALIEHSFGVAPVVSLLPPVASSPADADCAPTLGALPCRLIASYANASSADDQSALELLEMALLKAPRDVALVLVVRDALTWLARERGRGRARGASPTSGETALYD